MKCFFVIYCQIVMVRHPPRVVDGYIKSGEMDGYNGFLPGETNRRKSLECISQREMTGRKSLPAVSKGK